ncbi:hypothetical protein CU097_007602 [Rhizopus azygosporus]|uniref:Uncharacterized protein n=1 Tax=Rhizopus azygosporus TaxID=86630 RepID=A0A367JFZ7_RHIAZ|nr:hypothetical protein CU097_007602 [Rhizopus azygosporus]
MYRSVVFIAILAIYLQQVLAQFCINSEPSQKLKFKTYINNEKGTQEIVKRLFDNSSKCDKSNTIGAKNQNPVSLPPAELPSSFQWKRTIAFVNGSFC